MFVGGKKHIYVRSYVYVPIPVTSYPGRTKGGSLLNVVH